MPDCRGVNDMVDIVKAIYRRTIIPDNQEPDMEIKKYESEVFEFEAVKTDVDETTDDLIDACEREVLRQHKRLEEIRDLRHDSVGIENELEEIEVKLKAVKNGDSDAMWDENKLTDRKEQLSKLLDKVK